MLLVGLTGGIGSGKSTAADLLKQRGATVVDADVVGAGGRRTGPPGAGGARRALRRRHPVADGQLDRAGLARIAFADEESRLALDGITWPAIGEEFGDRIDEAPADAVVVCDVPLLAEGGPGSEREYVAVIVVEAPHELRLDRLEERGVARDDAERRMAAQATDDDRREYATTCSTTPATSRRSPARSTTCGWSSSGSEPLARGSNCHTPSLESGGEHRRRRYPAAPRTVPERPGAEGAMSGRGGLCPRSNS